MQYPMTKTQTIYKIHEMVKSGRIDEHRSRPVLACLNNGWHGNARRVPRYISGGFSEEFYPTCDKGEDCIMRDYDAPGPYCRLDAALPDRLDALLLDRLKGTPIEELKKLNRQNLVSDETIDFIAELGLNSTLLGRQMRTFGKDNRVDLAEDDLLLAACIGSGRTPQYRTLIGSSRERPLYVCNAGSQACALAYKASLSSGVQMLCANLTP